MIVELFRKQKLIFKIAFFVAFISFLTASLLLYYFLDYKQNATTTSKQQAWRQTQEASIKLEEAFLKAINIANGIAEELSSGELKKQDIKARLEENIDNRNKMFGVGVAYIPYINDPYIRSKSPYYVSRDSLNTIEKNDLLQAYTAPIYRHDTTSNTKIMIGSVYVDFLISDIKDDMTSLELGKSGYGFILSKNGTYIAHPINEYNLNEFDKQQKTIFEVADDLNDKQLAELGRRAVIEEDEGMLEHSNKLTGQDSWMFFLPIKSIGWSLVVVYIKDDVTIDRMYLRNMLLGISLFFLLFAISFWSLVTKAYVGKTFKLWMFVGLTSLSLLTEIGYIWFLELEYNIEDEKKYTKIVDRTGIDNFTSSYYKQVRNNCPDEPLQIPTGIYIESIEFPTANNVFLSGYVWQKYDNEALNELDTLGIFFPESIDDEFYLSYITEDQEENYVTYGWYYRITIQKHFDYSKYPLDIKNLLIQIAPKDMSKNVILTPDLESYTYLNPNLCPGLSENLSVVGWQTMYSNFVYELNSYKLDFGLSEEKFSCREKAPILYFDINFTRDFAGTIISKSIPIVVILFIMFVLLTISTKNIDYVTRILAMAGSFFFAIIYSHVSTRTDLAVKSIVYYEYFFISMYIMILVSFLDAILFYQNYIFKKKRFFFEYKNNLISKLMFWPFFFTLFLFITIYLLMLR